MSTPIATIADVDEAIVEAIRKRFRALSDQRDDWRDAHVSDVYGCDYATHARRSADEKPVENRTPESCLKMAIGVDVERYVAEGLSILVEEQGFEAERGERIAWNPETGKVHRGMYDSGHLLSTEDRHELDGGDIGDVPCTGCICCSTEPGEMIGHLDYLGRLNKGEVLFEIKSTQFFRGKTPTEPAPWYVEQTATYAVGIGATHAAIIVVDRNTGEIAGPFWLDLDAPPPTVEGVYDPTKGTLREQTIARAKEMLEATDPEAFPPDPKPRYQWQPKYCNLGEKCACISKSS